MIELRNGYWAVEVPEGAERFEVSIQDDGIPCYTYWYKDNIDPTVICLPPGAWEIVCTSKDATRMQASEIVEQDGDGFKDYSEGFHHDIPFPEPLPSLASLLASKGCDLNKTYLILKKQ